MIAPRIFTKVTIYDIDDFRQVWTDTEFNPKGHKTSREIFKLSRIVDYEYVQPMVDMRGAYCPGENKAVKYDDWSQYRPYQRGDPSTCNNDPS